MGLDLQRFSNIVRFYDLVDWLSPLLDSLHVHVQTILVAASKAGSVVGGVHLVPYSKDIWTIDSLAVDPDYRQHGLGARLISATLKFVGDHHGRKALTYVRADNVPSLRIKKELSGEFFDRRVLLMYNLDKTLNEKVKNDFLTREAKPKDVFEIYELCRINDLEKATVFEMSPRSFIRSTFTFFMDAVGLVSSKKWVLTIQGKIVGYVDLTYTSPNEAAKIEAFYVRDKSDLLRLVTALLNRVFETMEKARIRKVAVNLSERQKETIQILEDLGFKRLASFYGVAHIII